jgi:hypothetical protein
MFLLPAILSLLPAAGAATIDVVADPEVDLIATIWYLADPNGKRGYGGRDVPDSYVQAVRELGGEKHAAVKEAARIGSKGFAWDAPLSWAVDLDADLKPEQPLPASLVDRAGGQKNLDKLTELVRAFRRDTDFDGWYGRHQGDWASWRQEAEANLANPDIPRQLESWFGTNMSAYSIVVTPAIGPQSYGPRVQAPEGIRAFAITNVVAWRGVDAPVAQLNVLREFGHSFVNPAVEAGWTLFKITDRLFEPVAVTMTKQSYSTWQLTLEETLMRAAACRMTRESQGDLAGLQCVADEVHQGFPYVPLAYDTYVQYESDRGKYRAFDLFLPDVANALGAILSPATWIAKSAWNHIRSIQDAFDANTLTTTVVIPTGYTDDESKRLSINYTRQIASKYFGSRTVWDKDAAQVPAETSAYVIYGTTTSNALLAKYAEALPYKMTDEGIDVSGRHFAGTGLRLISWMANPSGLDFTGVARGGADWVVFTAQREADVLGINDVPHGANAWVVSKGVEVLGSGFFLPQSVLEALPKPATLVPTTTDGSAAPAEAPAATPAPAPAPSPR